MIPSRRFAIMAAGLCGTAMVVGRVIAAAFNLSNTKSTDLSSIDEQAIKAELVFAPMTAIAEASLQDFSQPEAPPLAEIAAASTPDVEHNDAKEAVNSPKLWRNYCLTLHRRWRPKRGPCRSPR